MHSFQILVDNELVTIIFKSLGVGLKIAKQLQNAKELNINTEKVKKIQENDTTNTEVNAAKSENSSVHNPSPEGEQLEQMRYARTITSYALQQPFLVDVHLNKFDHRIFIPSAMTCRTILATQDQRQLKEMLQLQSNSMQQIMQNQMPIGTSVPSYIGQPQPVPSLLSTKPPIHPPSVLPVIPTFTTAPPMTNTIIQPQKPFTATSSSAPFPSGVPGVPTIPPLDVVKQKIQELHQQIQKMYEYMLVQLFSSKPSRLVDYAKMFNMPYETIQTRDQVMQIVQRISEQLIQSSPTDQAMFQMKDNESLDAQTKSMFGDLMAQLRTHMGYYQLYQEQSRDRPPHTAPLRPLPTTPGLPPPPPNGFVAPRPPILQDPKRSSGGSGGATAPFTSVAIPVVIPRSVPPAPPLSRSWQNAPETLPASQNIVQMIKETANSKEYLSNQNLAQNILTQIAPAQVSRLINQNISVPVFSSFGTAPKSLNAFAGIPETGIAKEHEIKVKIEQQFISDLEKSDKNQGDIHIQEDANEHIIDDVGTPEDGANIHSNIKQQIPPINMGTEPFRALLDRYLTTELSSGEAWREARSDLATKLLQVDNFFENHQKFISQQALYKFHADFTPYENLALLTLALPPEITCFSQIKQNVITIVQCEIFAKLNKLVKERSNAVTDVMVAQQRMEESRATVRDTGDGITTSLGTSSSAPPPSMTFGSQGPINNIQSINSQVISMQVSKPENQQQKASVIKEMEMCNSFKEQVIDLGKKILPYVKASVMLPCMILILGVGDELNLDVGEGMRFFKSNINKVYHDNAAVFNENMEKVFILAITIIESMFNIMKQHCNLAKPRPLMYRTQSRSDESTGGKGNVDDKHLPQFTDFLREYLDIVQRLKDGQKIDEFIAQNYYFLNEEEIRSILGGHNYAEINDIIENLAVDTQSLPQQIIEKKVATGFGIERSETDSEDM